MPARLTVTHVSDPGCPWAWSASPALAVLQRRYGDQLAWRHVMIGLAEDGALYEERGFGAEAMALAYRRFRGRGMPFATTPRPRVHGTWAMCRVVIATRRLFPQREWAVFRALQFAQFTTTLALDDPDDLLEALHGVENIDAAAIVACAHDPDVDAHFAADRELARSAAGSATEAQGKAATTPEGEVRYTAPSLLFEDPRGRRLEAGGFQPVEAYDVVIANLDPSLTRRAPAGDPVTVVEAFPDGLATGEIAAVMAPSNETPDPDAAEDLLIAAEATGRVVRVAVGHDALWLPPAAVAAHAADGRFTRGTARPLAAR